MTPTPWSPDERAILDDLKARAGVPTDEALIALALYRLATWYDLWPPASAFASGFAHDTRTSGADAPKRKRSAR